MVWVQYLVETKASSCLNDSNNFSHYYASLAKRKKEKKID